MIRRPLSRARVSVSSLPSSFRASEAAPCPLAVRLSSSSSTSRPVRIGRDLPHLPYRRSQRFRCWSPIRDSSSIQSHGIATSAQIRRPSDSNSGSKPKTSQSSPVEAPASSSPSSSASSSTKKAASDAGLLAAATSSAKATASSSKPDAVEATTSPPPSQTSSSSSSAAGPSTVRVTDKRSDPEGRQAEITAREAEKKGKEEKQRELLSGTIKPAGSSSSSAASASQPPPKAASTASPPSSGLSSSQQGQSKSSSSSTASTSTAPPPPGPSSSELLKQRLQQAQERLDRPLPSSYGLGMAGTSVNFDIDGSIIQQASTVVGTQTPPNTAAGSTSASSATGSASGGPSGSRPIPSSSAGPSSSSTSPPNAGPSSSQAEGSSTILPTAQPPGMEATEMRPHSPQLDHLFDTRAFVKRLEDAGFLNSERLEERAEKDAAQESRERQEEVKKWIAEANRKPSKGKSKATTSSTSPPVDEPVTAPELDAQTLAISTQPRHRPHDPAEAIMNLTISTLRSKGAYVLTTLMDRVHVENQRYLFTAALSELRTELQVRARADAAALRSITTLLQREVDSLNQRMREDIERMKHDIQVDMNNRKGEAKEEQNHLEQEIQDLNNRFTISLSDLKTEIEQSIKWDLTRRALALVFGIASITVVTLLSLDYLVKRKERLRLEEKGEDAPSGSGLMKRTKPKAGSGGSATGGSAAAGAGSGGEEAARVRPAEELGLVEQYESDAGGGRFV